jgi:hypothetical protein
MLALAESCGACQSHGELEVPAMNAHSAFISDTIASTPLNLGYQDDEDGTMPGSCVLAIPGSWQRAL